MWERAPNTAIPYTIRCLFGPPRREFLFGSKVGNIPDPQSVGLSLFRISPGRQRFPCQQSKLVKNARTREWIIVFDSELKFYPDPSPQASTGYIISYTSWTEPGCLFPLMSNFLNAWLARRSLFLLSVPSHSILVTALPSALMSYNRIGHITNFS